MEIGHKIAKIRKDHDLTQEGFAAQYHVTQQTISNWENGRSYPDLDTLVQISDDFGISLDDLMKGDRKMVKEFDTKIKREKTYRIIVLAAAAVLLIGGALLAWRAVAYTTTKHKIEEKFANGVEKYGFVSNESDFDLRYSLETPDGISYEIQYEAMDSFMRSREWWDLPGKYIGATFGPSKTISVESEDSAVSTVPYNLRLSYTEGALFINATRADSGATIARGSIYFDEDGSRSYDMDLLMEQIVSDNSDTFEAILADLQTMWSDIYCSTTAN